MSTNDNVTLAARQTESIKIDNLLINFTTEFRRIWDSSGSESKPAAFWRPAPAPDLLPGFFPLGDVVATGHANINDQRVVMVVCEGEQQSGDRRKGPALRPPTDFEQIWRDAGSGANADCSIWRPIPPEGYVALGQLCSNGCDKPLLNTVRCVRADLVVLSNISDLIWNDKGSGARHSFSAWSLSPPDAVAGEIHFAPGTFVGVGTYNKPATHVTAYSLRMQIPLQINPPPATPELSENGQPLLLEPAKITQIAKLPWFTVKDPDLRPLEQLRTSPFYRLERTDQYVLVGYGNNENAENRIYKWTARRPQSRGARDDFSFITTIAIDGICWPSQKPAMFSARLNKRFTHTELSGGWNGPSAVEIVTIVPKNKAVAAYELRSTYRLLRENNTKVAMEVQYIDGNSFHLTEYPPEKDSEISTTPQPVDDASVATDTTETERDVTTSPLPETGLPTATDTAP